MNNNLKSAVAFFFLFFLNGFSIGNGKQGISYNVRVFMSGFAFRKTCIKHNVSRVRKDFERSQFYLS